MTYWKRHALPGLVAAGMVPSLLLGQAMPKVDPELIRQALQSSGGVPSALGPAGKGAQGKGKAKALPAGKAGQADTVRTEDPQERAARELKELKAREKGPRRFAEDLFRFRQVSEDATEGGIAEDYVLGTGDQLSLMLYGSKEDQQDLQVDGRGEVQVPEVGGVRVAGLTLDQARRRIQGAVRRGSATTKADVSVTKLREIRVFVLGEVYRPGGYMVPSLSSLVNILGLAGGPTAMGSFRKIEVVRGGRVVHTVDLYPLRAEGRGNLNVSLQNGDTVFVPLAFNQVTLEGAFTRVVGQIPDILPEEDETADADPLKKKRSRLQRQIRLLEEKLGYTITEAKETASQEMEEGSSREETAAPLQPEQRAQLEEQLDELEQKLAALRARDRGDHRVDPKDLGRRVADSDVPTWITRWQAEGVAPVMQFELVPGETAADVLRFAGGVLPQAFTGSLTLKRLDLAGVATVTDLPMKPETLGRTPLQKGDVLSALPTRDRLLHAVSLGGWVRAAGTFSRAEGLRVGDLLRRDNQVLPDTFLGRGEVIRSLEDGTTRYLSFDVRKALEGDPENNLPLEDRDRVELYRVNDFRVSHTIRVVGPMTKAGDFLFHPGMRAADLLFRAGVPSRAANLLTAELARVGGEGQSSRIIPLDLAQLVTTEAGSPRVLRDDALNPVLQPDDVITVFEKPNYKLHRSVVLSGEVARPGTYFLESEHTTMRELIQRAGGLTSNAMREAGIFIRRPERLDPSLMKAEKSEGVSRKDPTALGINEIMERLNETKRHPLSGHLQKTPVLHPLTSEHFNRLVVDFKAALDGNRDADVELEDGDQIIIPKLTDSAYVVGETASPFGVYRARKGLKVSDILAMAGGTTRNADTWNLRLLKADGRIMDSWVKHRTVEPGDVVIVPQKVPRDYNWQESLQAITPLALILNAVKK